MAINVKDKLITLESLGVAYSAEQDAREEADQALSTRIDNIVAPDGDPSLTEVSDARVSGSTTYPTLKARLDADKAAIGTDIDEIKADLGAQTGIISKIKGYYVNLTVDPVNLTPVASTSNTFACAVVDCTAGDKFIINGRGASLGRAWGFVDSSNHVLSVADANATVTDLELIAPANAVKLVLNDGDDGMSYKVGDNLASKITSGLSDDAKEAVLACFENVAWRGKGGKAYYDTLERILYSAGSEWGVDYTWLYNPKTEGLLSLCTDIITPSINSVVENVRNNILNLSANVDKDSQGTISYSLKTTTNNKAKLKAKVRTNNLAYSPSNDDSIGFRLQLSNGTSGVLFYITKGTNGILTLVTYQGNTRIPVISLDEGVWYIIEIVLDGNKAIININGEKVYESTSLATYYCTSSRVACQTTARKVVLNHTFDVDVAWITYKNNDTV